MRRRASREDAYIRTYSLRAASSLGGLCAPAHARAESTTRDRVVVPAFVHPRARAPTSQHAYDPTAIADALTTENVIALDCNSANAPPAGTSPPYTTD